MQKSNLLFRNGQNSPSRLTRNPFLGKDSRNVNVSIVITVLIYWILPPCLLKVIMFIRILGANLSLNLPYSASWNVC